MSGVSYPPSLLSLPREARRSGAPSPAPSPEKSWANGKIPVGKMKKVIRNGEITSLATALMAATMDISFHFLPRFY